jgi:hypothetical protein
MPRDPPRDGDQRIIPHDHPEIFDDHYVIRHTNPNDLFVEDGIKRLASGAFSDSSDGGMSVDIEEWMVVETLDPLHYLHPDEGAVRIRVGELRTLGYQVGWDPDGGHRHHGSVWGNFNGSKHKKRIKKLAVTIQRCKGEGESADPEGQQSAQPTE